MSRKTRNKLTSASRLSVENLENRELMDGHGLLADQPLDAFVAVNVDEDRNIPTNRGTDNAARPTAPEIRVIETADRTITYEFTDRSVDERGFYIERRSDGDDWKKINEIIYAGRNLDERGATTGTVRTRVDGETNGSLKRKLETGTRYCYRAVAWNADGRSFSNSACGTTTQPELKQPGSFDPVEISSAFDRVRFKFFDSNEINANYRLEISKYGSDQKAVYPFNNDAWTSSTGTREVTIENLKALKPNVDHCFRIIAVNPDAKKTVVRSVPKCFGVRTLAMTPEDVYSPDPVHVPFTREWTGKSTARLREISIPKTGNPTEFVARFVKKGRSTNECNNPNAVVTLAPGEAATPSQLNELYGSSSPSGPIKFLACVGTVKPIDRFLVQITYERDFSVARKLIPGDVNFDGLFNSSDLVEIFKSGEYEDDVEDNSTWQEGDFDGDGDFTTTDLVFAFSQSTYSAAADARTGVAWGPDEYSKVHARTNRPVTPEDLLFMESKTTWLL